MLALGAGLFSNSPARAGDLYARQEYNELKLRQSLNEEITKADFTEGLSLTELVRYVRNATDGNVLLDEKALNDAGIGLDVQFKGEFSAKSLQAILDALLTKKKLTYLIQDRVILITTETKAKNKYDVRVYPVHWYGKPGDARKRRALLAGIQIQSPGGWAHQGGKGTVQYFDPSQSFVVNQSLYVHERITRWLTNKQGD